MASYPSGNPGVYPLDPASPTGKFRLVFGDIQSEPYNPPVEDIQNYTELSDAEIEAYIAVGGDSTNRAIGYYYLSLAGAAAKIAKSIRDYDLQVDTTKRATDLRTTAQWWFDQADNEDIVSAEEGFEIVNTGTRGGAFIPEATVPVWGREYTWGRWR